MRDQNVRIAGYPRIEPKANVATADKLEFSAVFEVYPDIRLGDLSTVSIERPVAEVGPEDVEQTIDVLRRQRTRYEPVTRPAEIGDRVIVDFSGRIDGVEFPGGQAKDFAIVLGEGRMLPEFETVIAGMTAGETKSFGLAFPADYHGKEVAGKAADFTLTAKAIEEPQLPEVDAEFAKAFGIASGSVDELKTEIAANLEARAQAQDRGAGSRIRRWRRFARKQSSPSRARSSSRKRRAWRAGWRRSFAGRA